MAEQHITRIPLNIVATATGQVTEGAIVAVLKTDLDRLERLTRHTAYEDAIRMVDNWMERNEIGFDSDTETSVWLRALDIMNGK